MGGTSAPDVALVTKATSLTLAVGFEGGAVAVASLRPANLSLVGTVALPRLDCMPTLSLDDLAVAFSWSIQP
eukprot:2818419-Prymnesium_polylepis.4